MQNFSTQTERTNFFQSGVPLSETLPEDVFLSVQAGRIDAVITALDGIMRAVGDTHGPGPGTKYIAGLKSLLCAARDDLEVLARSKTQK